MNRVKIDNKSIKARDDGSAAAVANSAIRIVVAEFGLVGRSVSNGIQLVLVAVMSKMIRSRVIFVLAQAGDGRPGNLPGQQNQ